MFWVFVIVILRRLSLLKCCNVSCTKVLQHDWTTCTLQCSRYGLYTYFTRPFPFLQTWVWLTRPCLSKLWRLQNQHILFDTWEPSSPSWDYLCLPEVTWHHYIWQDLSSLLLAALTSYEHLGVQLLSSKSRWKENYNTWSLGFSNIVNS